MLHKEALDVPVTQPYGASIGEKEKGMPPFFAVWATLTLA